VTSGVIKTKELAERVSVLEKWREEQAIESNNIFKRF
jgi:hypothetical protein